MQCRCISGLAQLSEYGLNILHRAAHPFQFHILEFLFHKGRAHFVVAEHRAIITRGGFVEFDAVVLYACSLELLGHSLFHIARGLAHLELPRMFCVAYRIGVDAGPGFRLRRKNFFDGLTHRYDRPQRPHRVLRR